MGKQRFKSSIPTNRSHQLGATCLNKKRPRLRYVCFVLLRFFRPVCCGAAVISAFSTRKAGASAQDVRFLLEAGDVDIYKAGLSGALWAWFLKGVLQ